jgi:hypothetical protein
LKATPEFKAWEHERGLDIPPWQAHFQQLKQQLLQVKDQAKASVPPSLVPYSKHIAIGSVIALLLIVPMLFPLALAPTKSSARAPTASSPSSLTAAAKGKTSSSLRAPGAVAIPPPQKTVDTSVEDELKQRRIEKEIAAALKIEIAEAKRVASVAEEQQRQLVAKLEEASKREAALTEETKRLAQIAAAKKPTAIGHLINKQNLQKAFTISGGGRGEALKPPTRDDAAGKPSVQYYLQYAVYYLASLGPDVGLLTIEAGLLLLAAVLMLGLQNSRRAAEQVKKEYLFAYRRQMALLAKTEEAYEAAGKIALEKSASSDAHAAAAAEAAAALAEAAALKEQELQEKEQQLENKVEEVRASAEAQTSAWAAAAAQLLQLAASSPSKNNKNQPLQKSRLSKSSTPPSPNTLVTTVTDKYTQLRTRLTSAEAAATDAATVAETARLEHKRSEQRVSEMITDNELLKERLSETKKALDVATDAKAAAELHEAEVRAALEIAQQNLATVQAEKEEVLKEATTLKESLKSASEQVAAAVKGGEHLEAQVDQLTNSLGDESAQKQRAEKRCAQLESDLNALQILADGLQNQVSALEQRLDESMAAQTELKFASKQLEAAHAAAIAAASAPTGSSPALVQRALNEESAALERLTTAERRAAEASTFSSYALTGGEDIAPRPAVPLPLSSLGTFPPSSPQQINSARASSLIARAGKIASMLSEGMDGLLNGSDLDTTASLPPLSARSGLYSSRSGTVLSARSQQPYSARRLSVDSGESGSLTVRMARASELFSAAEQFLGQELPQAEKRPYRDIPLLMTNDGTVNVKVNGVSKESSADEGLARLIAAGNIMIKEAENMQSALLASASGSTPANTAAAERLSASKAKIAAAVIEAEIGIKLSEEKRTQHAALAAVARERQRALEDAQLALTAVMEEQSSEAAIASAAQHLQAAETAQQAASTAVYHAERDMYAAVSAQLSAKDALRHEQETLQEAFVTGTQLLNGLKETSADAVPSPVADVFA